MVNFIRKFFLILGVLLLGIGCARTFAPRITDTLLHRKPMAREDCLVCHSRGDKEAPQAPKRMLAVDRENCRKCHW